VPRHLLLQSDSLTLVSGLGLLEYLYMCEDLEMEMEPVLAVYAGQSNLMKSDFSV
jgi:hypothetical protein